MCFVLYHSIERDIQNVPIIVCGGIAKRSKGHVHLSETVLACLHRALFWFFFPKAAIIDMNFTVEATSFTEC